MRVWLVEIRLKDWVPVPEGQNRIITYEEVFALDEYSARHAGFELIKTRTHYEPVTRRRFLERGRPLTDYCAPDAVEL